MGTKKDPQMTASQKMLKLFMMLLLTREEKSLTELAHELDCSKQTVLRLIDELGRSSGHIDIDTIKIGKEHFYKVKRPLHTPKMTLSETDYLVLDMCRSFTAHLLGKELFEEATQTIEKSRAYFSDSNKRPASDTLFSTIQNGLVDYSGHHDIIHTLIDALKTRHVISITYRAITEDQPKTYDIMPLKLFSHKDTIYVNARKYPASLKKHADEFDPVLAVHRIVSAEKKDIPFEFPVDYDFEKIFNRHFGIIKDKAFKVTAEFTGWAAHYVSERTWSPDQKIRRVDETSIILEFTASSEPEVISWLLWFGEEARLIKPQHLIKNIAGRIAQMMKQYS